MLIFFIICMCAHVGECVTACMWRSEVNSFCLYVGDHSGHQASAEGPGPTEPSSRPVCIYFDNKASRLYYSVTVVYLREQTVIPKQISYSGYVADFPHLSQILIASE